MSEYPDFLYSPSDKQDIENILRGVFDNCNTPIAVTIDAYGIVKIIDLIFDEYDDTGRSGEFKGSVLVDEETHSFIVNFLNDQIIRLGRKAECEENEFLEKTFLNWVLLLRRLYKELVNKEPFH